MKPKFKNVKALTWKECLRLWKQANKQGYTSYSSGYDGKWYYSNLELKEEKK